MDLDAGLEHPLAIEILSLRDALYQQQRATQQATTQVQKYAFEALSASNRSRQLTVENEALQSELDILRAPRPTASPSIAEAELTLALRRVNSRLEHTERLLQDSDTTVLHAQAERERTAGEVAAAYQLLEEARSQVVELRSSSAQYELERKSYESALTEYAALVRNLEKRVSQDAHSLDDGPGHSLPEIVINRDTERITKLTAELARAQADLSTLQAQLDVERRSGEDERLKLAETRAELEKRSIDDKSAAGLVERYMKFSQHHTDVLQRALTDQSSRHEATRSSLLQRIEHLERSLSSESSHNLQLRAAVDTLVDDLSRESSERRREIRVRLAISGREAKVEEALRRWERRVREHPKSRISGEMTESFLGLDNLDQFLGIIDVLAAPILFCSAADGSDNESLPGPLGRMLGAEIAVEALTVELELETARRMELERERARVTVPPTASQPETTRTTSQPQSILTMPSSTSISLASHDTASRASLAESVTTTSVHEPASITPVSCAETSKPTISLGPPSPVPDPPAIPLEPESQPPPVPPPQSTIPFPDSVSIPDKAPEPTEPASLYDSSAVQELLAQLPTALKRYNLLQAAFRDCHLTLSALKAELRQKPRTYLLSVVERLDDYNEDARVEVEIRIADEARTANGIEAMLHLGQLDAVDRLRAFVDGAAPEVQRAITTATKKRDELEHDIAIVKLTVHPPEGLKQDVLSPTPDVEPASPSWGWKRAFHQSIPTRPASPSGLLFPSPQQTLRRMASGTLGHGRGPSFGGETKQQTGVDPITAMNLRVPMPAYQPLPSPTGVIPLSPLKPGFLGKSPLVLERPRIASMYGLGLGRSISRLDTPMRHVSATPIPKPVEDDSGVDSDSSVE